MKPAPHRPLAAAAALLAGILCVATMDAVGKILSSTLPVMQVNWARFFFHFLIVTPMVLALGARPRALLSSQRPHLPLHIFRGVMLASSSFCFFFAISTNPVPDAIAIFFIEPLIVMLLARFFIGEKFQPRLIIAAAFGLLGVLIILRPGTGAAPYDWRILFALAASAFFAGYIVSARHAAAHAPAAVTSWTTALFGLLPITLIVPFTWHTPTLDDWLLMAAVGALSGIGHTLIILSVRYAAASFVAVLHYTEVPIAAIISWLLFAHLPGPAVWIGITLIACANLYALKTPRPAAAP